MSVLKKNVKNRILEHYTDDRQTDTEQRGRAATQTDLVSGEMLLTRLS